MGKLADAIFLSRCHYMNWDLARTSSGLIGLWNSHYRTISSLLSFSAFFMTYFHTMSRLSRDHVKRLNHLLILLASLSYSNIFYFKIISKKTSTIEFYRSIIYRYAIKSTTIFLQILSLLFSNVSKRLSKLA